MLQHFYEKLGFKIEPGCLESIYREKWQNVLIKKGERIRKKENIPNSPRDVFGTEMGGFRVPIT